MAAGWTIDGAAWSSTSTRASAAWRAKRRVRPACATRRSSRRRAPPSSTTIGVRSANASSAGSCFLAAAVSGALAAARAAARLRQRCCDALPRLLSLLPLKLRNLIALAPDAARPACRTCGDPGDARRPWATPRLRVGLVTGCVQRVFFGHVNEATVRVLAAEGCEVLAPRSQGCCGALALHAGRDDDARQFARGLIGTFEARQRRRRSSSTRPAADRR